MQGVFKDANGYRALEKLVELSGLRSTTSGVAVDDTSFRSSAVNAKPEVVEVTLPVLFYAASADMTLLPRTRHYPLSHSQ